MSKTIFIVTAKTYKEWNTRYGGIPQCRSCGKSFKIGDSVVSKNNRGDPRRHHKKCLDEGSTPKPRLLRHSLIVQGEIPDRLTHVTG